MWKAVGHLPLKRNHAFSGTMIWNWGYAWEASHLVEIYHSNHANYYIVI